MTELTDNTNVAAETTNTENANQEIKPEETDSTENANQEIKPEEIIEKEKVLVITAEAIPTVTIQKFLNMEFGEEKTVGQFKATRLPGGVLLENLTNSRSNHFVPTSFVVKDFTLISSEKIKDEPSESI
jgi:hypothetical protein